MFLTLAVSSSVSFDQAVCIVFNERPADPLLPLYFRIPSRDKERFISEPISIGVLRCDLATTEEVALTLYAM
eukprot:jgi/Botrbrau1/18219/Bobra.53_1s0076.1